MKKLSALLILFLWVFAVNAQETDSDKAIQYNDQVIGLQNKLAEGILGFMEITGGEGATREQADVGLADLGKSSEKIIKDLEKLGSFQGNTGFYQAALALFKFYNRIILKEYKEMIAIVFKPELTEKDMQDLNALQIKITEEEKILDEKFQSEQTAFAKKYNFTLGENELQQKIDE